jgi:hypothetical protein
MSDGVIPVGWRTRCEPLAPVAAAALGPRARVLASRLLSRGNGLRGVARTSPGEEVLVVLGDASELPWCEEIVYLGRDPRAPALLLPTVLEPEVANGEVSALLERALLRRADARSAPLAVLPSAGLVVPCGRALPISRDHIAKAFGLGAPP